MELWCTREGRYIKKRFWNSYVFLYWWLYCSKTISLSILKLQTANPEEYAISGLVYNRFLSLFFLL